MIKLASINYRSAKYFKSCEVCLSLVFHVFVVVVVVRAVNLFRMSGEDACRRSDILRSAAAGPEQ